MSGPLEMQDNRLDVAVAKAAPTTQDLLEFASPSAALIATPLSGPARGVIWLIAAAVVSFVVAAGLIPVDKVVTAQGKLISKSPTIVLQPLDTAIVRAIDVHEGQRVHGGDVLARLDPTFAAADMGTLLQQVASLEAEVTRLHAEADEKLYVAHPNDLPSQLQAAIFAQQEAERRYKLENYRQKIDSLEVAVSRELAQANYYRQRLAVASSVEQMRQELQKLQVGSKLNSMAATDTRLDISRNLAISEASAEGSKRDLEAMVAERDAYENTWRAQILQNLQDQGRKLDDAREQLKKAQLRRRLVELRAPEDAVVMSVAHVSVGSVLQAGSQFITLVPSDAPLEVEADVAGSDAGFLRVGDPVVVKFDTFPFTQYGNAEGVVRVVSPDSFTQTSDGAPESQQPEGPVPGARIFYHARITLDRIKLHNTPPGFAPSPGMPVTADIRVGKRTVLNYMLGRVMPVTMEGMREP